MVQDFYYTNYTGGTYTTSSKVISTAYQQEYDNETGNIKRTRLNSFVPRILFYDGLVNCDEWGIYDNNEVVNKAAYASLLNTSASFVFTDFSHNTLNSYPYVGHLNNPYSPTQDLNFTYPAEYFYERTGVTSNNLFNQYWFDTIQEIENKSSKLLSGYFHLTVADIQSLSFRNIIYLDGQYWVINKIEDYSPFDDGLTKVELLKIDNYNDTKQNISSVQQTINLTPNPKKLTIGGNSINTTTIGGVSTSNIKPISTNIIKGFGNEIHPSTTGSIVIGNMNILPYDTSNTLIVGNGIGLTTGDTKIQTGGINTGTINILPSTNNNASGIQFNGVPVIQMSNSGLTYNTPVSLFSGTPNEVIFTDNSGNLSVYSGFTFDGKSNYNLSVSSSDAIFSTGIGFNDGLAGFNYTDLINNYTNIMGVFSGSTDPNGIQRNTSAIAWLNDSNGDFSFVEATHISGTPAVYLSSQYGNINGSIGIRPDLDIITLSDGNFLSVLDANPIEAALSFRYTSGGTESGVRATKTYRFGTGNTELNLESNGVIWSWAGYDGNNGDVLVTDGAGNLSFSKITGFTDVISFTSYTSSTNTSISTLQAEINTLSGNTSGYTSTGSFNAYTASTNTSLTNIQNSLTGYTSTGVFNTYTGNTNTSLTNIQNSLSGYTSKPTFSAYTASTSSSLTNLQNSLTGYTNTSLFNSYTGNTNTSLTNLQNSINSISGTVSSNTSNTIFVSTLGNDSTAIKYNISAPYKTIGAAVSAATTGDTVYVFGGTYNETGIYKDGVNYYFLNGAIIVPPTGTTTPVFQVLNPTKDVVIDGQLTINTAANHTVFDLSGNTNAANYYINFKQVTATNITGSDGTQPRCVMRFINSTACYAKINGDIRLTSVIGNTSYGALSTVNDGTNLTYNGNIICTSTSNAIYRSASSSATVAQYNGEFLSTGGASTIRINNGNYFTVETINGNIYNTSVANGIYSFSNSGGQFMTITVNANIFGNCNIANSYVTNTTINGSISSSSSNSPTYLLLNGGTSTNTIINGNITYSSFIVQGGNHKINGNVIFNGVGSYPSQGLFTQTGGIVRWNSFGQMYTTAVRSAVISSITAGKLVIQKGSLFPLTEYNSAGGATQHGLLLSGGTLQLEGVIDYAYSGNTTSNLAAINFQAGTLVLDGGRILNRENSANSISILSPSGTTNVQIFNNSFSNVQSSGGTITNIITGGGSLVTYSGITL